MRRNDGGGEFRPRREVLRIVDFLIHKQSLPPPFGKDGGESEGIVLYPSRSPSLGWKPTPPGPPCQGGKGHDEGFFNNPSVA